MIVQALEYLFKAAHDAQSVRVLSVPGDGRTCYVDQRGDIHEISVAPPLRTHSVDTVADIIVAAKRWNTNPVVWVSGQAVVLVPDDDDRRERVTLELHETEQFAFLQECGHFSQADMIRAFRTKLLGAEKRLELIAAIRSLKWRTSAEGSSDVQHGKESLGKSVESEVTGSGIIPELVVVNCAVYRNPGEEANQCAVGCDLEIDAVKQQFAFRPLTDEIENAVAVAIGSIRARIAEALPGVPVLYGSP